MEMTRRKLLAAAGTSVVVSGCLGDDGSEDTPTPTDEESNGGAESTPSPEPTESESVAVQVRDHDEHGEILVDSEGMTLYMFDQDSRGEGASSCSGGCADNWPPLTVEGEPGAGEDVTADITSFEREDGSPQVAANGWPLYYFANDESPGDANGQGLNDVWWVLGPDGTPIKPEETTGMDGMY